MAENMNPDKTAAHDRIETVDLQVEMARSYLDYAMSVIVGRALPDIRDGLKSAGICQRGILCQCHKK